MTKYILAFILFLIQFRASGQASLEGRISSGEGPVAFAQVVLKDIPLATTTDSLGYFSLSGITSGVHQLAITAVGHLPLNKAITITEGQNRLDLQLKKDPHTMDEVVVTGTMKEISRMDSPIPVEIITPKYFQKNPTPSLFEAVGLVNGVKPQINCNVCNTGDIHINGMEGPYTMILIDGMPIVSSLSTVYGLSGIPNSLVERIEIVKGPASSLYGSEAMGGIINVITKNPLKAPIFSFDFMGTSWKEYNTDISLRATTGNLYNLLGINYFNSTSPTDNNGDGFTDVTLQNRISVFNKMSLTRPQHRIASLALRYVYEDRWGGQMNWGRQWRGTDSVYGESIYTQRYEAIASYQLPLKEKIMTQFSYNWHGHDSYYGTTPYMASQQVAFAQAYWDKQLTEKHNFLLGAAVRYNFYDDNTPATASSDGKINAPAITTLPGVFVQDEWTLTDKHKVLLGYRYDYNKHHGNIHSPRLAYKWAPSTNNTLRASFGTGFRVVNLFTEDHAALTGARDVVIAEELHPERSYNGNLNYVTRVVGENFFANIDVTGFYSYFTNKIVADFNTDPNKIIYDNLHGYGISRGASLNLDLSLTAPVKVMTGVTYMNVYQMEEKGGQTEKNIQIYAPEWSGNFVVTYSLPSRFTIDLSGNWNGPMRLPVVPNDYRPEYSPTFCIVNIQLSKKWNSGVEVYGGVKNLFNFVPKDPIMRANDPFDKEVNDPVKNPNGYSFDPSYNYASLQGIRGFLGVRYQLNR
jgi:outer membrane receptor for ferrienterochelin and colicins